MSRKRAKPDRGIRSIFFTAMGLAPERRTPLQRFLDLFDRRHLGHALTGGAIGAGAAVAGFVALVVSLPGTVAADTDPFEVVSLPAATSKADRMPVSVARFIAAPTFVDLGVPPARGFVGPAIAYSALPLDTPSSAALGAIDAAAGAGQGVKYASLGDPTLMVPGAAAEAVATGQDAEDDEEDGAGIAVPRARPDHHAEAIDVPMPRSRPLHYASVAPMTMDGNVAPEQVEDVPPGLEEGREDTPATQKPNALGFFSSPTEPVKAPPRIRVETPFGIPYVLQTASVETACLKPDMIDLLHKIETHYHEKVVVTSAYRNRGRSGSMHRQCAAADIIVPGVGAEALAAYARSIAGIGGVGTYCHSELVHIDTGTPRDWKYGCGSFFAMRGAPGRWGKVPASLAAAQPRGDTRIDMSQMAD